MEQNQSTMNQNENNGNEAKSSYTSDLDSLKKFIQSVQDERNADEKLFKPERLQDLRIEDNSMNKHSYGLG